MTAPAQPKTLRSFRIVTDKGIEKLTPWFEDDIDLAEYIEHHGGATTQMFERTGGDMYEVVAGERMKL